MKTIDEIMKDYTSGKTGPDEANAALKEAGAGFSLDPTRNLFSADEIMKSTLGGNPPSTVNGWGIMDHGVGALEKIHVVNGHTPDVDMGIELAYVYICGAKYQLKGNGLIVPEKADYPDWICCDIPVWAVPWDEELDKYKPDEDMMHRPKYAGQKVRKGKLVYRYDKNGDVYDYEPVNMNDYMKDHGK